MMEMRATRYSSWLMARGSSGYAPQQAPSEAEDL
jgi:hypothetical protein